MVPTGAAASPDVLNSWKEIAAYLDRDVRTVMRWEQSRGMPVHRLPGGPKSAVYALRPELDQWRKGRKLALIEAPEARRPPAARIVVPAVVVVSLAVAAAGAAWWLAHRPVRTASQMTRLTYEPRVGSWPAISADGRLFAYTSDREGAFDIYVQQMGGHQPVRVTRDEADDWQPSLSPDGSHIAFRSEREGGGIFLTETLGGIERKIADGGSHPAFSPDGATIAYLVRNAFTERARMFLIPAGGGVPRPFQPEFELSPVANVYSGPLWSPDGQHILFEGMRGGDVRTHGLWVAPAGGGPAMQVGQVPPIPFGVIRFYVAWSGRDLYYVVGTSVQGTLLMRERIAPNPWRIAGAPEQIASSPTVYGVARVSGDGRLVVMIASYLNNVWSAPLRANQGALEGPLEQVTSETHNKIGLSVAANGSRFAYAGVFEVGHLEIRLMDVATRRLEAIPVSSGTLNPNACLSADGSRLGYRDFVGGKLVSYSVAVSNPAPAEPFCDGCSVAGFFPRSGDTLVRYGPRLVRQNISTGRRVTLIEATAIEPAVSPDDRWLAFVSPKPDGAAGLFVARVGDGPVPPQEWIPVAEDRNSIGSPQWSPAGNLLYYLSNRDSFSCVWAQSFDAVKRTFGEPKPVSHHHSLPWLRRNLGSDIGVTPDRLYLMMGIMTSNVWMMQVDRP